MTHINYFVGRRKKRIHKNIGKYRDRPKDRKSRMTKSKGVQNQYLKKTMQRSRYKSTTYLIGKWYNEKILKQQILMVRMDSSEEKIVCEICATSMYEKHCKIICPNCGFKWDCSDH